MAEERKSAHFGHDSTFVISVREYAAKLPNTGSQQHRLRHQDENWLISLWRWIVEHRKAGTDWAPLRRVVQAILDEIDVRMDQDRVGQSALTPQSFHEIAQVEREAGYLEDVASDCALHERSPSRYRRVVDTCHTQIEVLRRKARTALALSSRQAMSR